MVVGLVLQLAYSSVLFLVTASAWGLVMLTTSIFLGVNV